MIEIHPLASNPFSKSSMREKIPICENTLDHHKVDVLLAKEMNQLSARERDQILDDVHGVTDVIEETPEFVEDCIAQLGVSLASIPHKPEYDLAMCLDADYVMNRKFRIMFLRSERFDVSRAATRLVKHFREKQRLFGTEALCRDIEWKDLNQEDRETLQSGFFQVLPLRDRAGRAILCVTETGKSFKMENVVRICPAIPAGHHRRFCSVTGFALMPNFLRRKATSKMVHMLQGP